MSGLSLSTGHLKLLEDPDIGGMVDLGESSLSQTAQQAEPHAALFLDEDTDSLFRYRSSSPIWPPLYLTLTCVLGNRKVIETPFVWTSKGRQILESVVKYVNLSDVFRYQTRAQTEDGLTRQDSGLRPVEPWGFNDTVVVPFLPRCTAMVQHWKLVQKTDVFHPGLSVLTC